MRKFPKNWGTLIAVVALVTSVCAVYFDNEHFERSMELASEALETDTKHYDELKEQFENVIAPHVRHEEVYDHVSLLYDRLMLYRDWVNALPYVHSDVVLPYYLEASSNFSKAEEELRAGNFEQAMQSVATAYVSLAEGNRAYYSLEKAGEAVE